MAGKFNLAEVLQAAPAAVAPRTIEVITSEIQSAKRTGGEAILTIGRCLIEAKSMLSHGEWLSWLDGQVEYSERTAQNFMRLAREYSNPQTLADLGASKALALLALPEDERSQFLQEKPVIDMSSRELEQAIRERNEARAEAEKAAADQKAAEAARDEMARQMKVVNATLDEATRDLAQSRQELEALKARPVEVAVEQVPDPAAIEAARTAAIAEMQAKVDKAKRGKVAADEKRQAAEKALADANSRLAELTRAEKKDAMAADKDLVAFSTIFEGVQEQINKLHGYLLRYKNKGNTEVTDKLSRALLALAEKIKGAAEA